MPKLENANLILHCGAKQATLAEVQAVPTPKETSTWKPIGHGDFVQMVKDEIVATGFQITDEAYGLKDGKIYVPGADPIPVPKAKLFGVITVDTGNPEWSLAFGLRGSIDKSISLGAFWGDRMTVCDNMMYTGDGELVKKHSPGTMAEVPSMLADQISMIPQMVELRENTWNAYKEIALSDAEFHDIVCRSILEEVIPTSKAKAVLNEWREPRHREFEPRNLFSAVNAFTEVAKGTPVIDVPERLGRLSRIADSVACLN